MMSFSDLILKQRQYFATGVTKEIAFRVQQLQLLRKLIQECQEPLLAALKADLGKPHFEAYTSELLILIEEINFVLKHLSRWTKPQQVKISLGQFPAKGYIYAQPVGVVLIISPWNYPFQLMLSPLIGAIAAGNCAVLKPSELSPHTSSLIAKLISENFNPGFLQVVEGAVETSQALLSEKFDHIFFTGSTRVGKVVMTAAAQHLTPVTLELGGKSPCIVDNDVDIAIAARRIAWGKFFNAGQTCVAPDYVLVHHTIYDQFLAELQIAIKSFYGENPQESRDYGRVVNDYHWQRLTNLLQEGKILIGGQHNREQLYLAPTVITEIDWQSTIMQEEIFGPILPIMSYQDLTAIISKINACPKPLALYFFSRNVKQQERLLKETSFGGGCINDTIMHLSSPYLPLGGVGESGIGRYHGKFSFDTFSHFQSILKKSLAFDQPWRYPPYKMNLNILKWFL